MPEPDDGIDIALAAYREEGVWQLEELSDAVLGDLDTVAQALRRFPGDGGSIGLFALDEDVTLIVRVIGEKVRVLLSDITAADDCALARDAIAHLGLPYPEDEDEQVPAGDLDILGDLGLHPIDLGVLIEDLDLYPDEILGDIAERIGFGQAYDDLVGVAST